jgi:hypothetical protein
MSGVSVYDSAGLDFSVDRPKPHRLGFADVSISAGVGFIPAFAFRIASAQKTMQLSFCLEVCARRLTRSIACALFVVCFRIAPQLESASGSQH